MTLVGFFIALILLGLVFYLADRYLPMAEPFKAVLRIVSVLVAIFLVLALFGVFNFPFRLQ